MLEPTIFLNFQYRSKRMCLITPKLRRAAMPFLPMDSMTIQILLHRKYPWWCQVAQDQEFWSRARDSDVLCAGVCACWVPSVVSDSFATPWTVAHQVPLSMGFSQQEYWSGLPYPPPGDFPDPGIKPVSPAAPALHAGPLCWVTRSYMQEQRALKPAPSPSSISSLQPLLTLLTFYHGATSVSTSSTAFWDLASFFIAAPLLWGWGRLGWLII